MTTPAPPAGAGRRPVRALHTVRVRLTVVYGSLFLVTGLGLLTMTYVLVARAIRSSGTIGFSTISISAGSASPTYLVSERPQSPAVPITGHEVTSTLPDDSPLAQALTKALDTRTQDMLHNLALSSGVALALMLVVALVLGWFVGGRMLRPLRTVTTTVQQISHTNLHERLSATGPDDEIKELSDTFDGLLERLESSFEAQRRFVANASHELRTPLARQRVIAQVALADPDASVESLREAHERVLASGVEQQQILEALLALARGQHGPDDVREIDLAAVAEEALARCARPEALTVTTDLQPALVVGDPQLVRRLVTNLVENAVVHNVDGGFVDVRTHSDDIGSVLVVSNAGEPLAADEVDGLIEPFRRAGAQRTRTREGLGLGLSIVAAVAASHDATLELTPRDAGGLVVTVSFPSPTQR